MTNRTLCLHASSRARGTRQRGGNAEAGFRHSQDLLLLSSGVSTGRSGPRGRGGLALGVEGPRVSGGQPGRALSSRERGWRPAAAAVDRAGPSLPRSHARVSLPPRQGCRPCPACLPSEEQGPERRGSRGCPALASRLEASISYGGAPASGARPPLRGCPPLQALLWVVPWGVRPGAQPCWSRSEGRRLSALSCSRLR